MGGGIKRCFCLTSVAYIGPKLRTERPRKTNWHRGSARDSDTTFKVKGQGHQAALVGCSSHYIIYMDDTIIITRASRCLSIMNIHGARRTGRRKACRLWTGGGLQWAGWGHICAQLVFSSSWIVNCMRCNYVTGSFDIPCMMSVCTLCRVTLLTAAVQVLTVLICRVISGLSSHQLW